MSMLWDILAGTLTGILSGMGIGGGTLLMLYMTQIAQLEQHVAQAVTLLYFIPCAGGSLIGHIKTKQIAFDYALPAIFAGVISAGLCAYFAQGVDAGVLRKIFAVLLLVLGFNEVFKKK